MNTGQRVAAAECAAEVGSRVRIVQGLLRGLTGQIVGVEPMARPIRYQVAMSFLGESVVLSVDDPLLAPEEHDPAGAALGLGFTGHVLSADALAKH